MGVQLNSNINTIEMCQSSSLNPCWATKTLTFKQERVKINKTTNNTTH